MGNPYDVGDLRRPQTQVKNAAGTVVDPSALTFQITVAGSTTSYTYGTDAELVKASTGVYYVDFTVVTRGKHTYRWASTSPTVAEERSFSVQKSLIA